MAYENIRFEMPQGGRAVTLGSPTTESGRSDNEAPREVRLTVPFEMGATPVTQLEWFLVMGNNPSNFSSGPGSIQINGINIQPNRPVEQVSWNDIQEFLRRRNDPKVASYDSRYRYDLPTEAQWEFAARAGTTTAYSFEDNAAELGSYAWHGGNSGSQTHDVAQLRPNPFGLYDMHGNVWEWTRDAYTQTPPGGENPFVKGDTGSSRVLRGGSWGNSAQNVRSARRDYDSPGSRHDNLGFRLLRTPR